MRMFLMHYFAAQNVSEINAVQQFAPNENSGDFYQPFLPIRAAHLSDEALARARPLAQQLIASRAQSYCFVKTHNWYGVHHGTPTVSLNDSAAAVYVVRNPLDIVISYAAFRDVSYDQAIDWVLAKDRILPRMPNGSYFVSGSWSQNVSSWRNQRQLPCTILRYEDLLSEPENEFRKLLNSWRLSIDNKKLAAALEATSLQALQAAEAKHGFRERPRNTKAFFRSGRTGEGHEKLSQSQKERIFEACGPEMEACGYALQ